MKRIFKPDIWKLSLTIALLYISSRLWRAYVISHISDTFPHGFPFQFYVGWGPCRPEQMCSETNWLFLVFDVVIWYVISAIFVDRIQKKTG